jgi:hypothetical protein
MAMIIWAVDVTLRGLADYKGDELVTRFMAMVDRLRPLHVSIVGGEPLVRYRELGQDSSAARRAEGFTHSSSRARCARFHRNGRRYRKLQIVDLNRRTAARARRPPHARDL